MDNLSVNTVSADGLAPLCARPSVGTVMTTENHIAPLKAGNQQMKSTGTSYSTELQWLEQGDRVPAY